MSESTLTFGFYRVTGPQGQLFRRSESVRLPPKAVAVLWTLASRAGQLVSKEELFATVWPDTVVSEYVLTGCIRDLRQAFDDDVRRPRYIETVYRRGYRFIAPLATLRHRRIGVRGQESEREEEQHKAQSTKHNPVLSIVEGTRVESSFPAPDAQHLAPALVGRKAELTQLHSLFAKALSGERQLVFVTGESGIGKTALVNAFLSEVRSPRSEVTESLASQEENQNSKACPACASAAGTGEHSRRSKTQKSKVNPRTPDIFTLCPLTPVPWIAEGQCFEQYGTGEAYLPVLDALSRLSRGPQGTEVITHLRQSAPSWLGYVPGVLSREEQLARQRQSPGVAQERLLRELAEAFEALTYRQPLLLVLEDLQWSDPSTVALLSFLARRREAARLLILGTYRPVDLILQTHPLRVAKQELQTHGQCQELILRYLTVAEVQQYISPRFAAGKDLDTVAAFVHQRTDGHPLFMVNLLEYLQQHPALAVANESALEQRLTTVATTLPQGLQQFIAAQVDQLSPAEQAVLEVASVAGAKFTVASVVAGLQTTSEEVETLSEGLARQGQFLEDLGLETWPDGTVSGHYEFRHALYQEVVYQRIGVARRARLHRHIGAREEIAYGEHASEIAGHLARHFTLGQDHQRAAHYRQQAAEASLQRNAYQEARMHCSAGLTLLPLLPDTPERSHLELSLQMTLGVVLAATKGYAAPEVERAYLRAQALCEQTGDSTQLVRLLRGLIILYTVRANFPAAQEMGTQLLTLAQRANDATLLELAHMLLGVVLLWLGDLTAASDHFVRGVAFVDPRQNSQQRRALAIRNGQDHHVALLSHAAWTLWLMGYPDQAVQQSQKALHLAHEIEHPFSEAFALIYAAGVHQFCGTEHAAQQRAKDALTLADKQGFAFLATRGRSVEGWVLLQEGQVEEGIARMRQSLAAYETLGIERGRPHFLADLADACGKAGQTAEGLTLVAKAQERMSKSNERWYEAELWRIKGNLLLAQEIKSQESRIKTSSRFNVQGSRSSKTKSQILDPNSHAEAEECFLEAIEVARQQQAKSLELRAVMSLTRLRQQQVAHYGSRNIDHATRTALAEAHSMLSAVYGWFAEGFDTTDLQEAKALLEALRH